MMSGLGVTDSAASAAEAEAGSRLTTLRLRLVIGFLLVSVPAMLASAYVAARLISNAFESNVEQWLGETSRFFQLEIREATSEAQRVANVIAQRLESIPDLDLQHPVPLEKDFAILTSVGYDLIAVYNSERIILFQSRAFSSPSPLPLRMQQGIFRITADSKQFIMAGAVQPVRLASGPGYILVGTWLDETYLGGIRVVTSLDVRLYANIGGALQPVLPASEGANRPKPLPDNIRGRLAAGAETIFDREAEDGGYRAIYTGFLGVDGELAAAAFIGLARREGFFEQIGRWRLFSGIFLFGTALSIGVGAFMSGILVQPLQALTRGVRSITAGDYRQRVPVRGGRELAELAAGFNTMAEQLGKMHELEAELRRRDRLAALGQAATMIAHEVRNPLGIIKTSTEVVRKRARLGEAEDRMMGYVIDEVRRIETLVRDFLDFAQPKEPRRVSLRPRDIVDGIAAFAGPELAKRGIALETLDEAHAAEVFGDPDQIHQACLNLVLNAMDAMPTGGRLFIRLAATGTNVSVTIADSGPGVPGAIADQIFSPFFTTKAKGTGLGLAKVQTVAMAHGGSIRYERTAEGGASFVLTLPRNESEG